jgi:hypothetical protein
MGFEPAGLWPSPNAPEADPASERAELAEGDGRFGRRPALMEIDRGLLFRLCRVFEASGPPLHFREEWPARQSVATT